jgi:hypothetical protein
MNCKVCSGPIRQSAGSICCRCATKKRNRDIRNGIHYSVPPKLRGCERPRVKQFVCEKCASQSWRVEGLECTVCALPFAPWQERRTA